MYDKDVALKLITSFIDELIFFTDSIINELEGDEGAKLIGESWGLINTRYRGKYQEALSNSLMDIQIEYLDSLANIKSLNMVLREYKNIIDIGSNGDLQRVSDEINIDFDNLYKVIRRVEAEIEDEQIVRKVVEYDYYFDTWMETYKKSLNDNMFKSYETDENGNMTEAGLLAHLADQKKEKIFRTNCTEMGKLEQILAESFVYTKALTQTLEVTAGILSNNLTDFSQIWEAFDFTKTDYKYFLEAEYVQTAKENLEHVKTYIKSLGDDYDSFIDLIIKVLEGQTTSDVDADIERLLKGFLALSAVERKAVIFDINARIEQYTVKMFELYFSGNIASEWEQYGYYLGFYNLLLSVDAVARNNNIYSATVKDGVVTIVTLDKTYNGTLKNIDIKIEKPPLTNTDAVFDYIGKISISTDLLGTLMTSIVGLATPAKYAVALTILEAIISSGNLVRASKDEAYQLSLSTLGVTFDGAGNANYTMYTIFMLIELSKIAEGDYEKKDVEQKHAKELLDVLADPSSSNEQIVEEMEIAKDAINYADSKVRGHMFE